MGRCSRHPRPALITRGHLAHDLAALGIAPGDTVMLHASVGAIGWIVGGPDRVLEALLDVLGDDGTLMIYVGWDGSPYDVTLGMPELPPELATVWPPYDPESSHAVRSWGVLGEYLRTWPGARRSRHPDSSFVAVGPRADDLVGDHALQYGMGEGSPLARLCEMGGKVVLLGSSLSNVTLLHHAEHLADVASKRVVHYWMPILENGAKTWVPIEEFDTEGCLPWRGSGDLFEAIVQDYVKEGRGTVGAVGMAKSYLFDAADLVAFAVEWIEETFTDVEPHDIDIRTRRADSKDHRELVTLLGAYESEAMSSSKSESRRSMRVDDFLEEKDHAVFVAETTERMVGMLIVSQTAPDRGELQLAYVEPGFREHGVLRELEADASEYLRDLGCHRISLRVDAQNEAAREAWHNLGYASTMEHMERPL